MSEQQKDLPAFPEKRFDVFGHSVDTKGMTLRDYFAAKAMAAILPAWIEGYCATEGNMSSAARHIASAIDAVEMESTDWLTDTAYMIADEMLLQREVKA